MKFNALKIAAAALLLAGCAHELEVDPGTGTGGETVHFTASVPGAGSSSDRTRAMSEAQQSQVETIDLLVLDVNGTAETVAEYIRIDEITQNGDEISFDARLARSTTARRIVVMTNHTPDDFISHPEALIGMPRKELMPLLFTVTMRWNADGTNFRPIPMYGETPTPAPVAPGTTVDLSLTRMTAAVDVVNEASADGFILQKIHVANRQGEGYIAPAWDPNTGRLTGTALNVKSTFPFIGAQQRLTYPASGNIPATQEYKGEIFLFEAAAAVDGATDHAASRVDAACLLLEGTYQGEATWYRVDFNDGANYLALTRNHKYTVTVLGADATGYTTPEEALASYTQPLKIRVHHYDEGKLTNMVYDGQYWLGTGDTPDSYDWIGEAQRVHVETNYAYNGTDWEVEAITTLSGDKDDPSTWGSDVDWLQTRRIDAETMEIEPDVSIAPTATRTAVVHLRAGRLRMAFEVAQNPGYTPGDATSSSRRITDVSNSYILAPERYDENLYYFIPLEQPWNPAVSSLVGTTPSGKIRAELLWTDTEAGMAPHGSVRFVKGAGAGSGSSWVVVRPGGGEGNTVVSACTVNGTDTTVVWSYHIWTTDYNPGDGSAADRTGKTSVPGGDIYRSTSTVADAMRTPLTAVIMDRFLGALSVPSQLRLQYQWGRNVPFYFDRKYDRDGNPFSSGSAVPENTLAASILNPGAAMVPWFGSSNAASWDNGTADYKTVFDPCPVGWRVPKVGGMGRTQEGADWGPYLADINGWMTAEAGFFPQRNDAYLWYANSQTDDAAYHTRAMQDGRFFLEIGTGGKAATGISIRCVAETVAPIPQNLAAPGVIGYVEGTNELTLRGSADFAGTPVGTAAEAMFPGEGLHEKRVFTAFFKWGSLIATDSETTPYSSDAIVWAPAGLSGTASAAAALAEARSNMGTYDAIPYGYTGVWPVNDVAKGIGDPCTLLTDGGKSWRTPSGNPWNNEGGAPFGTINADWPLSNGARWVTDLPVPGAVGGTGSGEDWSMFLPATVYFRRLSPENGGLLSSAGRGTYWSSSPYPHTDPWGFSISLGTIGVTHSAGSPATHAFAIRCVEAFKATPPKTGVPAPENILAVNNLGELNLDGQTKIGKDGITSNYLVNFKWGSLVGINPVATGDPYDATDVSWIPPGFAGTITDDYLSVPYVSSGAFPASNDLAAGIGDPCKLATKDGQPTTDWRMPTGNPFEGLAGAKAVTMPTTIQDGANGRMGIDDQFYATGFRSGDGTSSIDNAHYWTTSFSLAAGNHPYEMFFNYMNPTNFSVSSAIHVRTCAGAIRCMPPTNP